MGERNLRPRSVRFHFLIVPNCLLVKWYSRLMRFSRARERDGRKKQEEANQPILQGSDSVFVAFGPKSGLVAADSSDLFHSVSLRAECGMRESESRRDPRRIIMSSVRYFRSQRFAVGKSAAHLGRVVSAETCNATRTSAVSDIRGLRNQQRNFAKAANRSLRFLAASVTSFGASCRRPIAR